MNARTPTPRRFTSAEFTRMAQRGGFGDLRVELRRGWIVEMSPQHIPHAALKAELYDALRESLTAAGSSLRVWSEASVDFGGGFQPMPDIVVFDPAALPDDLQGPLPATAVKLIVEVASTSLDDDLGDKRAEYAEAGLPEYWVADVKARILYRHAAPRDGVFTQADKAAISEGALSFTVPGLGYAKGALA